MTKTSSFLSKQFKSRFDMSVNLQHFENDDSHRFITILPSVAGFHHQAEQKVFEVNTETTLSLSDHLFTTAPGGILQLLRRFEIDVHVFLDTNDVSNVYPYLEGRLLNIGSCSRNSRINLIRTGSEKNLNCLFTQEAKPFRNLDDSQLALQNDQTRLCVLRETHSGQYTNYNLILGFSKTPIDLKFLFKFLLNNLSVLGLYDSKFCHLFALRRVTNCLTKRKRSF